jgi:uncharacterized protein YdcH (DUF465 family)
MGYENPFALVMAWQEAANSQNFDRLFARYDNLDVALDEAGLQDSDEIPI